MNNKLIIQIVLIHFAASPLEAMAQLDPVCAACEYRVCTYEKALSCSCTGVSRAIDIDDSNDREYSQVSLGFAIDDTGSMGGVIDSVKATIQAVVSETSSVFDKVVLATFNDPYKFDLIESKDALAVRNFVGRIAAHGGDDCPEMALSGIRDVARRVSVGSAIFVFTDASAKDLTLEAEVKALLLSKDIRLNVLATAALCNMGGEFMRLTSATKGSIYHLTPVQWDVQHVMNYIRKYARYGVRYIRGMPRSLDDLRIVANGTCTSREGRIRNLLCTRPLAIETNLTAAIRASRARQSECVCGKNFAARQVVASGLHWAACMVAIGITGLIEHQSVLW